MLAGGARSAAETSRAFWPTAERCWRWRSRAPPLAMPGRSREDRPSPRIKGWGKVPVVAAHRARRSRRCARAESRPGSWPGPGHGPHPGSRSLAAPARSAQRTASAHLRAVRRAGQVLPDPGPPSTIGRAHRSARSSASRSRPGSSSASPMASFRSISAGSEPCRPAAGPGATYRNLATGPRPQGTRTLPPGLQGPAAGGQALGPAGSGSGWLWPTNCAR
jgi:hypothetical protein